MKIKPDHGAHDAETTDQQMRDEIFRFETRERRVELQHNRTVKIGRSK